MLSLTGGVHGGGARLSAMGEQALARYRELEADVARATQQRAQMLQDMMH